MLLEGSGLSVACGRADGSFDPPTRILGFDVSSVPLLQVGDFNDDGFDDVMVPVGGQILVYPGQG